jgi:hypothetical protein
MLNIRWLTSKQEYQAGERGHKNFFPRNIQYGTVVYTVLWRTWLRQLLAQCVATPGERDGGGVGGGAVVIL